MPSWVYQIILGVLATAWVGFTAWVATSIVQIRGELEAAKKELSLIPLSGLIQAQLLNSLHHDNTVYKECDDLIDKFKMATITHAELSVLRLLLGKRTIDTTVPELERKKAVALLAIMEVVVIEKQDEKSKIRDAVLSVLFGLSLASFHALKYFR